MSVVTLVEAKTHLNITVNTWDVELQAFVDGAEAAIGRRVGPLEPVEVSERVVGRSETLTLNRLPVSSLTSVTSSDDDTVLVADLYVGQKSGVVRYSDEVTTFPESSYTAVYQSGWDALPDDLRLAVLELVRHLWMTQRGGGTRPGSPPSTELSNTLPGSAFAFPFRVEQLLTPFVQPGIA